MTRVMLSIGGENVIKILNCFNPRRMKQSLKFIWKICEVNAYLVSTAYSLKFGWMQISVYNKLNFFKSAMSSDSRSVKFSI